ncbi:MAG: hypothetical protein SH850_14480 [Planctomycetaceae bacterium]|nr:hypothetical protein [Planctomycetaceae bacterium]
MWTEVLDELRGRGAGVLIGMLLGTTFTAVVALRKRRTERLNILHGDARDTVVIAQHVIESAAVAGPGTMRRATRLRIRSLGQAPLNRVIPNGHLAADLLKRAHHVSPRNALISMDGAEGSYLLESLTNFVCDRVANAPFDHDAYIMAPCCEPAGLVVHQPVTILLIRVSDLRLFEGWESCRDVAVEHGADGTRVLTLMELAQRFRQEQEKLTSLRQADQRTRYMETMYVLDLALDQNATPIETKPVPWDRFTPVLQEMSLA